MPRSCWGITTACIVSPRRSSCTGGMWDNAVDKPGPLTERLGDAARRAEAWVAIGVNEREAAAPGPSGTRSCGSRPMAVARRHRKLVPTMHERVFWGQGPGDDLGAVHAEFGRLGGLICWENFMPAARRASTGRGVDFYLAPTADDRDIWVAAMRTFAFEAGAFVLSAVQYLRTRLPRRLPAARGARRVPRAIHGRQRDLRPLGQHPGRARARPRGDPVRRLRPRADPAARRVLDIAGHYDRPDLSAV